MTSDIGEERAKVHGIARQISHVRGYTVCMMVLTPIELTELPEMQVAAVRLLIPRARIGEVMGPAIGAIFRTLAQQSVRAIGPVCTHHFRIDPLVFDFEVAVPVNAAITQDVDVQPSIIPAFRIARTIYSGPYEGLGAAWQQFESQLDSMHLIRRPNLIERYLRGPESELPPTEWMTELCHVLATDAG